MSSKPQKRTGLIGNLPFNIVTNNKDESSKRRTKRSREPTASRITISRTQGRNSLTPNPSQLLDNRLIHNLLLARNLFIQENPWTSTECELNRHEVNQQNLASKRSQDNKKEFVIAVANLVTLQTSVPSNRLTRWPQNISKKSQPCGSNKNMIKQKIMKTSLKTLKLSRSMRPMGRMKVTLKMMLTAAISIRVFIRFSFLKR